MDHKKEQFLMIEVETMIKIEECLQLNFFKNLINKDINNKLLDIKLTKHNNMRLTSFQKKYEESFLKNHLNEAINDFDWNDLLRSRNKSSAFKPKGEVLENTLRNKSIEKSGRVTGEKKKS